MLPLTPAQGLYNNCFQKGITNGLEFCVRIALLTDYLGNKHIHIVSQVYSIHSVTIYLHLDHHIIIIVAATTTTTTAYLIQAGA